MSKYFKLVLLLFCIAGSLSSCCDSKSSSVHLSSYKTGAFALPNADVFTVYIAETAKQQRLGLSNIKTEDFDVSKGMLFPQDQMLIRQFWMPETHFDLDVFFMDKDFFIIDIHRGLQHYPFKPKKGEVPMSKKVLSQHVLELKAYSALAEQLQPGMQLEFRADEK